MPTWSGKWKGGRTYVTRDGRTVYVLRKMLGGKNFSITLDVGMETRRNGSEVPLPSQQPAAVLGRTAGWLRGWGFYCRLAAISSSRS